MKQLLWLLNFIFPFLELLRELISKQNPAESGITEAQKADMIRGVDAFTALRKSKPASVKQAVARGYKQIEAYGHNILSLLENLSEDDSLTTQEKQTRGISLVQSLSDKTKVYQAEKGDDAKLLTDLKLEAEKRYNALFKLKINVPEKPDKEPDKE